MKRVSNTSTHCENPYKATPRKLSVHRIRSMILWSETQVRISDFIMFFVKILRQLVEKLTCSCLCEKMFQTNIDKINEIITNKIFHLENCINSKQLFINICFDVVDLFCIDQITADGSLVGVGTAGLYTDMSRTVLAKSVFNKITGGM